MKVDALAASSPDSARLPREHYAVVSGNDCARRGIINLSNLPAKERADNQ
jgi:hypothetical protein